MNHWKCRAALAVMFGALLPSVVAEAHWCDDLWESAYNIVVRPASDTISVPASGSATLEIFVQNNMGYALPNFVLVADLGGSTVQATRTGQKVAGTLFSGEKAKYTLKINKSGGGQVTIEQINFSVQFGESAQGTWGGVRQWGMYPMPASAKATVIKKASGDLSPAIPVSPAPSASRGQSKQLELAAFTDFIDLQAGLDGLLQLYCAGRGSWNSNSVANLTSWCPNTSSTNCQTRTLGSSSGTKYDYPKLWATVELAARKSSLGCARIKVLRDRLKCGIADPNLGFSGFAMIVLGYLGEDPATRTFLQGKIDAGGDLGTIAKAALLLFGKEDDKKTYLADVQAGTQNANAFVSSACAAALGIALRDDASVESVLIPRAEWVQPDTSDNGKAMYAAHLIALVAWDRRGFAPDAGDKGVVTFFEGGTPTPFVPGDSCSGSATGTGGVPANGGAVATGGVVSPGGTMANGGAIAQRGGATSSGGVIATGGVRSTGGVTSSGGTIHTGGAVATGGRTSPGNTSARTGGSTLNQTGGAMGGGNAGTTRTGGANSTTAGDPSTTSPGSSSGCSVSQSSNKPGMVPFVILLLLGVAFRRMRRRDS